jgi:Ca2+:H+ antiporter
MARNICLTQGTYHFECKVCPPSDDLPDSFSQGSDCKACKMYQPHPTEDPIYKSSTRPLMYICAFVLLLTYAIGLWFTLRTHNHKIYGKKSRKKRRKVQSPEGVPSPRPVSDPLARFASTQENNSSSSRNQRFDVGIEGIRRRPLVGGGYARRPTSLDEDSSSSTSSLNHDGTHDNPGWGIFKSASILMTCTIAYALIAEILIDAIDDIIEVFPISEKILGLTLFAIVPTITEFYNAISFAMSGNIVLSLEIGSAYAIQVALLQIPVLVVFSAIWNSPGFLQQQNTILKGIDVVALREVRRAEKHAILSEFTLVFPQWEFYCLAFATFLCKFEGLCLFLVSYVYLEGKSTYFKGSLLLLTYFVLIAAFFFEPIAPF